MWGQPGEESYQRIDGIVAVVGDEIVLASDIRERVIQAQMEGNVVTDALHEKSRQDHIGS